MPRQRTPVTDTQMDIERAAMERDTWSTSETSEDFWNSAREPKADMYPPKSMPGHIPQTEQKMDSYPIQTLPAHVPQTNIMAFSASESSSSSLYSSMESVEAENDQESNMNQKNELRNQEISGFRDRHQEINDSGLQSNTPSTSHLQPKKIPVHISERQMSIDDNNNYRPDAYSDIEKKSDELEEYRSTKYLGIQSAYDNQIQMKGRSDASVHAQRTSIYDDIHPVQKGNKPFENVYNNKPYLGDFEYRTKSSEIKTNMSFGQGQRNDTNNKQSKGGNSHTNVSQSTEKPSFGGKHEVTENKDRFQGGFGRSSGNEQASTSDKGGFGQPISSTSEQRTGFGNQNTSGQPSMNNRGGFGRPNMKNDSAALIRNAQNENGVQRNSVGFKKQLAPETEDWDEEIEDFPSNVKQTYGYSLDHMKASSTKNKVISEKQLIETHKKELHYQRKEPSKEVVDLDITPVDSTPDLKKVQKGQRTLPTSTPMVSTCAPRNTALEARNTVVSPNKDMPHEQTKTGPKESHLERNRRLQVLKDLSKSPEVKKIARAPVPHNAENKVDSETYNYQGCHSEQNANVEDKVPSIDTTRNEVEKELPKPLNQPVKPPNRTTTPEKTEEVTVEFLEAKNTAQNEPVANQATKTPDSTTAAQQLGDMPAGLPPHLMQAYLQYLAQSGTADTTNPAAAQNTGLMGGLLPGLGIGLGMPLVSPFANPLYSPMMPFGMNPLMMNPLMAMSMQAQQQQLAGQLGANVTNNNSVGQTENVEVKQAVQTEEIVQEMEIKTNIYVEKEQDTKTEQRKQENTHENIVPLFSNMDIQAGEFTNEQLMPKDKEHIQCDEAVSRPNYPDIPVRNPDVFVDNAKPPGKAENLMSQHDVENIRIRRPSKEQGCTLRIPREPSVSSRLYGVHSSPVTDDPAVVRMSSAEVRGTDTFVDQSRHDIRSGAFDDDPSILRFEKRSAALNSPEKDTDTCCNVPAKADDIPRRYDMSGWMSNGPSIIRTIQNASNDGEMASEGHTTGSFQNPEVYQNSANRFPAPLSIPSRTFVNSQAGAAARQETVDARPPRGRGGFGTPSMPRRPTATGESDRDQVQNPARPSFNTKSLSERFAGIKKEDGEGQGGRQFPPSRPQDRGDGFGAQQYPARYQGGGDGFSARKLPPRLQAQREKNQQVKDMISQLRKETEASQQAGDV